MLAVHKSRILNSTLKSYLFLLQKVDESCFSASSSVLPTQAQVIICGAGAVGNSVAYHLIKNGWTDVLLIDKDRLEEALLHYILMFLTMQNLT